MKKIINEIKNKVDKHESVFVYGGWGIGKTHLIKNEFMKKYENDLNMLYIDSRAVDFSEDVFGIIADYIESILDEEEIIKNMEKKH